MTSHDLIDLRKINVIQPADLPPPPGTHYRIPTKSVMSLSLSPATEAVPLQTEEVVFEDGLEDDQAAALALAEAMGGEIEGEVARV